MRKNGKKTAKRHYKRRGTVSPGEFSRMLRLIKSEFKKNRKKSGRLPKLTVKMRGERGLTRRLLAIERLPHKIKKIISKKIGKSKSNSPDKMSSTVSRAMLKALRKGFKSITPRKHSRTVKPIIKIKANGPTGLNRRLTKICSAMSDIKKCVSSKRSPKFPKPMNPKIFEKIIERSMAAHIKPLIPPEKETKTAKTRKKNKPLTIKPGSAPAYELALIAAALSGAVADLMGAGSEPSGEYLEYIDKDGNERGSPQLKGAAVVVKRVMRALQGYCIKYGIRERVTK